MNDSEMKMIARIMNQVLGWGLSRYNTVFLVELALRRKRAEETETETETETIEISAQVIMSQMQEICKNTEGLENKRVIETSSRKSLLRIEEELADSTTIKEELLRGNIIVNVLSFLLEE